MFAPSGGKIHNVNNKQGMDLVYLLPHPPPLRRHLGRWRCRRPASTWAAPPRHLGHHRCRRTLRAACPPPTGNVREGWGGWVRQGEGGMVGIREGGANVIVVAVLATIFIFTTAIASAAATADVVSAVDTAVADNAVAGGRAAGLRRFCRHCPHPSSRSRQPRCPP